MNEDLDLKQDLRKRLKAAGISSIELDRPGNKLRIAIRTARPGIIIGKRGAEIEKLKAELQEKTKRDIYIDIPGSAPAGTGRAARLRVRRDADREAGQLPARHAQGRGVRPALRLQGHQGLGRGRLNGKMIARSEWHLHGRLPLQTLRADIDYGFSQAHTTYGVLGVKCWIYKGEIIDPRGAAIRRTGREEPEPARRREARSQAEKERDRLRRPTAGAAPPEPAAEAPQAAEPPKAAEAPKAGDPAFRPPMAGEAPETAESPAPEGEEG